MLVAPSLSCSQLSVPSWLWRPYMLKICVEWQFPVRKHDWDQLISDLKSPCGLLAHVHRDRLAHDFKKTSMVVVMVAFLLLAAAVWVSRILSSKNPLQFTQTANVENVVHNPCSCINWTLLSAAVTSWCAQACWWCIAAPHCYAATYMFHEMHVSCVYVSPLWQYIVYAYHLVSRWRTRKFPGPMVGWLAYAPAKVMGRLMRHRALRHWVDKHGQIYRVGPAC